MKYYMIVFYEGDGHECVASFQDLEFATKCLELYNHLYKKENVIRVGIMGKADYENLPKF